MADEPDDQEFETVSVPPESVFITDMGILIHDLAEWEEATNSLATKVNEMKLTVFCRDTHLWRDPERPKNAGKLATIKKSESI